MGKKQINNSFFPTIFICVVFLIFFLLSTFFVNKVEENSCIDTMNNASVEMAKNVRYLIEDYEEQLKIVTDVIMSEDEFLKENVVETLSLYEGHGMLTALAVLFENDEFVVCQNFAKLKEELKFEVEAIKAPYSSEVFINDDNRAYAYFTIPIIFEERVRCVVYGLIDIDKFSEVYKVNAFDGMANMYVVETRSGEVELDASFDLNSNLQGDKRVTAIKEIIDADSIDVNAMLTTSGCIKFYSESRDKNMYGYFMPVGIRNWTVVLLITEDVALKSANLVKERLFTLGILEMLVVALYLLWILRNIHKDTVSKEKKLKQSMYMFEIQQTLFDAHKDNNLLVDALHKVAEHLTAEVAFIAPIEGLVVKEMHYWASKTYEYQSSIGHNLNNTIPEMASMLSSGKRIIYYNYDKSLPIDMDKERLARDGIKNLMLVPIIGPNVALIGFMGVANMSTRWYDTVLLDSVSGNFMMALHNIKSYKTIERMGTVDELTGLKNRNSYQQKVQDLAYDNGDALCCIYIDANGLHDLNNKFGHRAGDEMLIFIGNAIADVFKGCDSYRIGGDEFVLFTSGWSLLDVDEALILLKKLVDDSKYSISVGISWYDKNSTIENFIRIAEERMYEDKREFYRNLGDEAKARIETRA